MAGKRKIKRRKRVIKVMDANAVQPQQEGVTPDEQSVASTEAQNPASEEKKSPESESVEVAPVATVPDAVPHGQVDPSFNCVPCQGEGLLPSGVVCTDCKGTGKV